MTQKKQFLLPLIVLVTALVLGACTPQNSGENSSASNAGDPDNGNALAELDSLSQAVALGQTVRCAEVQAESGSESGTMRETEATEYLVKGGRMKIKSTDTEAQTTRHFLIMDNSSYIWTDGVDTGYMFSVDPEEAANAVESFENLKQQLPEVDLDPEPEASGESEDEDERKKAEKQVEFDCQETDIADSEFELPQNVNFISPADYFSSGMSSHMMM